VRSLVFEGDTWAAYEALREADNVLHNSLHKWLCKLLKEMLRGEPSAGLGKPEQLRHSFSGFWSKRISQRDQLIYQFDEQTIYLFAIGGQYDSH